MFVLPSVTEAAGSQLHQVVARTAASAVKSSVLGMYSPRYNRFTCSTQLPMHRRITLWASCPFTSRFRQRLLKAGHVNNGVEFCGNQYPPRTVTVRTIAHSGSTARVNAHWNFGVRNAYTSTFVVVRRGVSWFVDDEYLAGKPSADIYSEGTTSLCH
jgi:hypothetical protein